MNKKEKHTKTEVIKLKTEDKQQVEYIISEEFASEEGSNDDDYDEEEEEADDSSSLRTQMQVIKEEGEDFEENVDIVVEHVCGKCNATFDNLNLLRSHLVQCRDQKKVEVTNMIMTVTQDNDISFKRVEAMEEDEEESGEGEQAEDEYVVVKDGAANLIKKKQEFVKGMKEKFRYPRKRKMLCFCCDEEKLDAHTGKIPCDQCNFSFNTELAVEKHKFSLHSDTDEFACAKCDSKCPTSGILALHMQTHEKTKPFACKTCGRDFTRKYHLERHLAHTACDDTVKKVILKCDVCDKKFSRLDNLREHLRNHMGNPSRRRDYQCPYCEKAFYGSAMLNIHIRTHTGEKPFPCDLCEKSFSSTGALRKHRRVHTGEKPYSCSICETKFAAKETLNRHFKTHTGERPHKCKICSKSFIQATQLKSHMFNHTGEDGFKCSQCDKVFNRKSRLDAHIKYQHGTEDPQECKICNRTFTFPTDLKRHALLHMGVKEFQCGVCEKMFTTKHSLLSHLRIHQSETPSTCDLCNRRFIRFDCLERHVKKHHRDQLFEIIKVAEERKIKFLASAAKIEILDDDEMDDSLDEGEILEDNDEEEEVHYSVGVDEEEEVQTVADKNITASITDVVDASEIVFMDDETLKTSVSELLNLLVDEDTLKGFGWPETSVEEVLSSVILECGHSPANYKDCRDYTTIMRENTKLLFTVVIDDESIKSLLNNHTIDEVILRVLKMTK